MLFHSIFPLLQFHLFLLLFLKHMLYSYQRDHLQSHFTLRQDQLQVISLFHHSFAQNYIP